MIRLAWAVPVLALAACAACAWRTVRHPLWYARYLAARYAYRTPRRDPDGEPLGRDEMRAFLAIVEGWRDSAPAQGSRA